MAYYSETSPTSRIIGFSIVVAMHVALVWALLTGLGTTLVEVVKGPIEVETLMDDAQQDEAPPPPPPQTLKPPPVYVPPVEVNVAPDSSSSSTAIQAVSTSYVSPKIVATSLPDYPSSARHLKAEGRVVLQADVDERGRLSNLQFVRIEGMTVNDPTVIEDFKQTAMRAAKSWRAKPATTGGVPTAKPGYVFSVVFRCREGGRNNCD